MFYFMFFSRLSVQYTHYTVLLFILATFTLNFYTALFLYFLLPILSQVEFKTKVTTSFPPGFPGYTVRFSEVFCLIKLLKENTHKNVWHTVKLLKELGG